VYDVKFVFRMVGSYFTFSAIGSVFHAALGRKVALYGVVGMEMERYGLAMDASRVRHTPRLVCTVQFKKHLVRSQSSATRVRYTQPASRARVKCASSDASSDPKL
jgi:hypothetical protein